MPPLNLVSRSALAIAISQALTMNSVQTATIEVDSDTDDGTGCTLREAFLTIKAGSDLINGCTTSGVFGASDTINFDSFLINNTIALTQGQLYFGASSNLNLTINGVTGNRPVISGNNASRVFYVRDSTLNINNLTISGGSSTGDGGGIIARSSTVNLTNSILSGNTANLKGGGMIASSSNINLTNSTLSGNSAGDGGGINARASIITLANSTLSGNSASGDGGGIVATQTGSINLTSSSVTGNSANNGGGVRVTTSNIDIANSTISDNFAIVSGGGIYSSSNTLNLTNSTVAKNSANIRGGINVTSSAVSLTNNLILGNRAAVVSGAEVASVNSSITATYNLFGDDVNTNTTAFSSFTPGPSNIIATSDGGSSSPLRSIIGPLSDNRSTTQTHALKPNSPAIGSGDNNNCLSTDQRGEARSDGACDIGAFEFNQNLDVAIIEVDSSTDDGVGCTLREAVDAISIQAPINNGCAVSGSLGVNDIINFAPSLNNSTITLTQANVLDFGNISAYTTINGLGKDSLEINGYNNSGIFSFRYAKVDINNLTITDGSTSSTGGGIYARASEVTLSNSTLSGNSATSGGGGIESYESTITLLNSTLLGNSASTGGGIRVLAGKVIMINSTVSGNSANTGGGIRTLLNGSVTLTNSTLSGNSAQVLGGGIFANPGNITLISSTLSDNSAGSSSGGLYVTASNTATIINSLIAGNRAPINAEVRFNGATVNATNNLFGDSSNTNIMAFGNFMPVANIIATSNGSTPSSLGSIIGLLSDNRGPTQTHVLRLNSPARDGGVNASCLDTDQRGEARSDGSCDIGAVELNESLDMAAVVVDSDSDDGVGCTLRDAIETFNSSAPLSNDCVINGTSGVKDTINFDPSLNNSTISLTQATALTIGQPGLNLTVNGLGQSSFEINGYNNGQVFYIRDNTVSLNDLTIAAGSTTFNGGAISASSSNLTLNNISIAGNSASFGGGLAAVTSSVTLNNSVFISNFANESGGGISVSSSSIALSNTTISANSATVRGGGIHALSGDASLSNSTISGNSAGAAVAELLLSQATLSPSPTAHSRRIRQPPTAAVYLLFQVVFFSPTAHFPETRRMAMAVE